MIRGMHHISLATADLDRFVHFYRDLLGVKLDRISAIAPGWEAFENVVVVRSTIGRVLQEIHPGSPVRPAFGSHDRVSC
jgi:catechol 2,3-dioxygenase-like lactoylglutathione lyase family enzyme